MRGKLFAPSLTCGKKVSPGKKRGGGERKVYIHCLNYLRGEKEGEVSGISSAQSRWFGIHSRKKQEKKAREMLLEMGGKEKGGRKGGSPSPLSGRHLKKGGWEGWDGHMFNCDLFTNEKKGKRKKSKPPFS